MSRYSDQIRMDGEYKGYKIAWDDRVAKFHVIKDHERIKSFTNIDRCRKFIDRHKKTKFERISVVRKYSSSICRGTITSHTDNGTWFVDEEGNRQKEWYTDSFFHDNKKNKKAIDKIFKLNEEMDVIKAEIANLYDGMERVTKQDLEKAGGMIDE